MAMQLQEHDRKSVIAQIAEWLNLCAIGLEIDLAPERLLMMSADVLDTYTYESLEDVRECLKSARKGVYGWGMEKRGIMNMVLISFWMTEHLEIKSIERQILFESAQKSQRETEKEELKDVDYEAYKIRMRNQPKQEMPRVIKEEIRLKKEKEFLFFRKKYLKDRQKP